MVNENAKSPNTKRKSLGNPGQGVQTPKKAKLNESVKTPNKTPGKNAKTPAKNGKTPNKTPGKNVKTPNTSVKFVPAEATPAKATPAKPKAKKDTPAPESGKKSPKKVKMFAGTAKLSASKTKLAELRRQKKEEMIGLVAKIKAGDKEALQKMTTKMTSIFGRQKLTKTAKKKLNLMKRLLKKAGVEPPVALSAAGKAEPKVPKKGLVKKEAKKKQQKVAKKPIIAKPVKKEAGDEEEDSSESDYEVEAEVKPGKLIHTQPKADGESDDEAESGDEEESDDEEADSDDEEMKEAKPKPAKPNANAKKNTRYVVFVGNLPFDTTKEEIMEHFKKAGEVRDVRIQNDPQTNKPRGFAYVEVTNEESYQKALSLHHTTIKGRRINVLYTQGGKKKGENQKKDIKAKNFKLNAMRKQGQLAGSVKESQKRSARRAKGKAPTVNGS